MTFALFQYAYCRFFSTAAIEQDVSETGEVPDGGKDFPDFEFQKPEIVIGSHVFGNLFLSDSNLPILQLPEDFQSEMPKKILPKDFPSNMPIAGNISPEAEKFLEKLRENNSDIYLRQIPEKEAPQKERPIFQTPGLQRPNPEVPFPCNGRLNCFRLASQAESICYGLDNYFDFHLFQLYNEIDQ